jgi:sugar phosphate isomerase/epimerase
MERLRHGSPTAWAVRVTGYQAGWGTPRANVAYRLRMHQDQIALQLYTVRRLAASDLAGTLRDVAAIGYRAVELAGLPPTAPGELARLLDDAGLHVVASHESIETLRHDPMAVADRLSEVRCPTVIVPWLPEEDRQSVDDVRRFAAEIGELAGRLADRGLRLGYHNHAFEFAALDGTTTWDVLLAEMPPEVVLELDVYWAAVGGRDPAAVIRDVADRIRLLHMKDRGAGPDGHDVPAGSGILAFPDILAAARAAGVEWYIAEQDEPSDALADIGSARRYLGGLAEPRRIG